MSEHQDDAPDEPRSGNGAADSTDEPEEGQEATGMALAPESETDTLRRRVADLEDQLLRRRADFDNYRRRVERDRVQAGVDAEAALVKSLVPTLDNLDRALAAGGTGASLREGVELTRRELLALLESRGLTVENPVGRRFDPQVHQALSHEQVAGFADGAIVEVFGKGYLFKDRLVRPALVKVAKGDEPGDGSVQ
jgi:molecular chaperone GrpE